MTAMRYPVTPDGRYFVVRGRLWRRTDPRLDDATNAIQVAALMKARRAVRDAPDAASRAAARRAVDAAKVALGERGPVWWDDGAPDYGRRLAVSTPYRDWFATVDAATTGPADDAVAPRRARRLSRATAPLR